MMLIAMLLASAPPIQSQMELSIQAGNADKAADAAMNAQYRQTMATMKARDAEGPHLDALVGPNYQNALLAAQRAWLAFRDAECMVEGYEFRGGTAQGEAGTRCLTTLTQTRTRELKEELWQY